MHWALGEADMCRRAHALPFPIATSRPEQVPTAAPSAGRVAQRDRMRGSTRVFEGRDITTITSPGFHSVNGNGNGQDHVPYGGVPAPLSLPGIGSGQGFPGYDEAEDEEGEDEDEEQQHTGPRVQRRRISQGTRLPGVAELDRTIAADYAASEGGRLVKQEESGRRIKHEHDRRGSSVSGGSGGSSRRSR